MLMVFLVGELDKFFCLSEDSHVSADCTDVLQNVLIICETHQTFYYMGNDFYPSLRE